MKKVFLFILTVPFFLTSLAQQSNIYEIEKLEKPDKLLNTVSPDILFKKVECKILKLSVENDLVPNISHAVIGGGFLEAYKEHRPVTISPPT